MEERKDGREGKEGREVEHAAGLLANKRMNGGKGSMDGNTGWISSFPSFPSFPCWCQRTNYRYSNLISKFQLGDR